MGERRVAGQRVVCHQRRHLFDRKPRRRVDSKRGASEADTHHHQPWLPLLSLLPRSPVPHLSLPCCLHTLDDAFTTLDYTPPPHPHTPAGGFDDGLEAGSSRYKSYVMWLGWCGLQAGWQWEKEPLRIPSTRGWGIVARKRWATDKEQDRECRTWALQEVNRVRQGGAFKVREKEGNDH